MNCPHTRCPGCPSRKLSYPAQLKAKQERLKAATALFSHLPTPRTVEGSAWTEGYRHRLKLPVHHGKKHISIGLYDKGRVLHTPDCPVLVPALRDAIPTVMGWMQEKRSVHSVDLRVSDATGQLQIVLATRGGKLSKHAARELMKLGIHSVAVSTADPKGKRVMGRKPRVAAGATTIEERIGDTRYDILPGSFFQTDPRQAKRLHALVLAAVGKARTVVDLYSGVGAYALRLAPHVQRVIAVEEVPQAAAAARRRAPKNVNVITSKVEDYDLSKADVVLMNPARRGSDPASLKQIAKQAKRVVYVSCGPETLARDLDIFAHHGMRTVSLQPIDLFPQTAEVETVAVLERGPLIRGPWNGNHPKGKVVETIALGIGPLRKSPGVTPIATVAGHTLARFKLARPNVAIAGSHKPTRRFFAEKAGLMRPLLQIVRTDRAKFPLHGDLVLALRALGYEGPPL